MIKIIASLVLHFLYESVDELRRCIPAACPPPVAEETSGLSLPGLHGPVYCPVTGSGIQAEMYTGGNLPYCILVLVH